MRLTQILTALAVLAAAGSAQATPFFRGNQIDDFGVPAPAEATSSQPAPYVAPGRSSLIAGNYVDDFGAEAASGGADAVPYEAPGRSSLISGNYVDDFGPVTPSAAAPALSASSGGEAAPRS